MKYYIDILILLFIITGCDNKQSVKENIVAETFDCKTGLMKPAWYEHGIDEPIPYNQGLQNEFIIVVDTNNKATNFISFDEEYLRRQSIELDTTNLDWTDGWEKLTVKQKWDKVYQERKSNLLKADSIHIINNQVV